MRAPLTPPRIQALDRRAAAIREAGHVVIGRHLGIGPVWGEIFPFDADEPGRTWAGHTWPQPNRLGRLSHERQMMYAVAGMVSVHAWICNRSGDWPPGFRIELTDPDCMSETDWDWTDSEPGEPTDRLVRCAELVAGLLRPGAGPLWPSLLAEARSMIAAASAVARAEKRAKA